MTRCTVIAPNDEVHVKNVAENILLILFILSDISYHFKIIYWTTKARQTYISKTIRYVSLTMARAGLP